MKYEVDIRLLSAESHSTLLCEYSSILPKSPIISKFKDMFSEAHAVTASGFGAELW